MMCHYTIGHTIIGLHEVLTKYFRETSLNLASKEQWTEKPGLILCVQTSKPIKLFTVAWFFLPRVQQSGLCPSWTRIGWEICWWRLRKLDGSKFLHTSRHGAQRFWSEAVRYSWTVPVSRSIEYCYLSFEIAINSYFNHSPVSRQTS